MNIADFINESFTERLTLNANGEECFIEYRSTQSDEFIEARTSFEQSMSKVILSGNKLMTEEVVLGQTITTYSDDYKKLFAIMMAKLIVSWSFDDAVTLESAATFLYSNPAVLAELDRKSSALSKREDEAKKPQLKAQKESSDS